VLRALRLLGFETVRVGTHVSLRRDQEGVTSTITLPNHRRLKGPTLQTACHLAGISRDEFLAAYRSAR